AEAVEFVEVDPQLVTVERVGVAVASEGVAQQSSRLAGRLVEARCAAAWVIAWPERFEELVPASRTAVRREVGDEFGSRLPTWLFLLAAGEFERPYEKHARQYDLRVIRL